MAQHLGKDAQIKLAATGETLELVGERKSWKITTRCKLVATPGQGKDWETYLADVKGFDVSLDGHFDLTDTAQAALIEGATIDFEAFPLGSTGITMAGSAIIETIDIATGTEDTVAITMSAKGNGPLTRA